MDAGTEDCPAVIQLDTPLVVIGGQLQHQPPTCNRLSKDQHAVLIGRWPLLAFDGFVPARSKQPMDHKRIFLFTNDDDPLRGDEDEQKKVNIVAKVPPISPHSSSCSIPQNPLFFILAPRHRDQLQLGVGLEAIFSQKYGKSIRLVCSNK